MPIATWSRATTLAFFVTTTATAAVAQAQTVTIRAFDAKGKDTGKCIRGVDAVSEGPGGYRLADCDRNAANQKFLFDTGKGGKITQTFGASATSDGLSVHMAFLGALGDSAWFPGATVGRVSHRSTSDELLLASKDWRWIGRQIANQDERSGKWCLTTMPGQGPDLRIDLCSKTATLTQWDVKLAK